MLNNGKNWTAYGTSKLMRLSMSGESNKDMARALARTPKAIERKKHALKRALFRGSDFGALCEGLLIYSGLQAGQYRLVRVDQ